MATLLITHDLGLASEYCGRIAVMHAGHIVETAPTAELFAAPRHPYTAKLIAATPGATTRLDALAVHSRLAARFAARRPASRAAIASRCERRGADCGDAPLPRSDFAAAAMGRLPASASGMGVVMPDRVSPRNRRCSRSKGCASGSRSARSKAAWRAPAGLFARRRGRQLHHRARRDGRAGRRVRLRQIDPRSADYALDRPDCRYDPLRRRGHRRGAGAPLRAGAAARRRSRWCFRMRPTASIRVSPHFAPSPTR